MHFHRHQGRDGLRGWHAMRGDGRFGGPGHGPGRGWGEGRERFGGGGGGRRRRLFDGGELRLVLLALIGETPRHGYDLIRAIEERSGGAYAPSPGVVYPTLTMLGDMEQIVEAESEGNRRRFAVTDAGRAEIDAKSAEIAALFERLDAIGREQARTSDGPIRRGFMNLRTAVQAAAAAGDRDAAHAIAAILDEAAQKIERL